MTDPALQALLDKLQIAELLTHRQLVWDWNHDAPEAEHWMRGLLAPDPSVLRLSGKFPADPVYAPR
jgi:hypothetical protein